MGDGGGSQTTSDINIGPWRKQRQYLVRGFEAAKRQRLNPLEFFPGNTYVPFSGETEQALGMTADRARAGSPLLKGAQGYTGDVLSGKYLDPASNPHLAGLQDSIMSMVQPGVASQFAGAGRTGGSALANEALGRGVSRGMSPYLFGQYGQERGFMENAASRAPELAREDYFYASQLARVGAAREGKAGEVLGDKMARYNFEQTEPQERLARYMRMITGNYGQSGSSISTTGTSVNPWLAGLGGALGLAGMPVQGTQGSTSLGGSALGK